MRFKKILSVKHIKKLENREFKKRADSFSLMISAGNESAKKIIKIIGRRSPIAIICGPGNNGGDGFIISDYLSSRNYKVDVFCFNKKNYKGDALKALKKVRIKTQHFSKFKSRKYLVLVDCVFGIGLNRKISGYLKSLISEINKSKKIISIDIPSGIHGDTGKILGCAVRAGTTLALHAKKTGHTINSGKKYSGKITVVDIGISSEFNV
tara:strand:- start:371 stop:997 length:627 start_codon:yes stop_codon:yes gene_type:complete